MMHRHIATPAGIVAFFPLTAHADVFDWSVAGDVRTAQLGTTKGGQVHFRSGHIDRGEHLEVAVELTWIAKKGKRSHVQLVIQEMADAHPRFVMDQGIVTVIMIHQPWGSIDAVTSERCWAWEASGLRFVEVPCP